MDSMRLLPGDVLAKDLLHPETHHPLLPAGTVLTQASINKLRALHLEDFALGHLFKRMLDSSDLLEAPCYQEQLRGVREQLLGAIEGAMADDLFDLMPLIRAVEAFISVFQSGNVRGSELRSAGDYDSSHPINVMLLALVTARELRMSENQLLNLGVGALLHDIGRYCLPQAVFNKDGKLSISEFGIIRKHPDCGLSLLKRWNLAHVQALEVVRGHHERLDGSGYPDGLRDKQIPLTSALVAIADTYDAMLSDRPYRRRVSPSLAYQCIRTSAGRHFAHEIVQAFLRQINPYPLGSKVILSTGEIAEVIQENQENPLLPVVKVFDRVIDLAERKGTILSGCMPRRFARAEVQGKVLYDGHEGSICNISGSGICFEDPGDLKVNAIIRLRIEFEQEVIDAQGKVMWSRPGPGGKNLVGLLFTQLRPADHLKILRQVEGSILLP